MKQTLYLNVPIDRQSAIEWAGEVLCRSGAVFIDVEATGFGLAAEIVEIAVVNVDGVVLFQSMIKPEQPIPIDATLVHGIDDKRVADSPNWRAVSATISELLSHQTVVAYNVHIDRKLLEQSFRRESVELSNVDWRCAMRAFAAFAGERSPRGRGFRWHPLDAAADRFGIEPGGHRAVADAETCRQVVRQMAMAPSAD